MVTEQVAFHGTPEETAALLAAFNRHCHCEYQVGLRRSTCPGHDMMVRDQRALNGLLFMRRRLAVLRGIRGHLC